MARLMTLTPADFRKTMAVAVTDDLFNGQPELQFRAVNRQADDGTVFQVYEVQGFINPAQLGTFGAQQLEQVMEHRHPGLLAQLNGQGPQAITREGLANLIKGTSPEQAASEIVQLIARRLPYQPGFDDV